MNPDDAQSPAAYAKNNRETLRRIFLHSNDVYSRACALTLLHRGSDATDIEQLRRELEAMKQR